MHPVVARTSEEEGRSVIFPVMFPRLVFTAPVIEPTRLSFRRHLQLQQLRDTLDSHVSEWFF